MNKKALADIVSLGEGFTTESKKAGTTGLGREICVFANATGGIILIGVADTGEISDGSGIKRIRNHCRDYGVEEPIIEVSDSWFTITFPRPRTGSLDELDELGTISVPSLFPVRLRSKS